MERNEQQWIELAKQGDNKALAHLLQLYYPFVKKYLIKLTFDLQMAEDLTQETMVRCIHKIKLYNGESKFSSWLITLATRIHIDHWRKRKREKRVQQEETSIRMMRWQLENSNERWSDFYELLSHLSADVRTSILLKHYYGYRLEEIAEMMDVPVGTVKSRIHHGIKMLRKELVKDE